MNSNLPHIDSSLKSFSCKALTPGRQKLNSLINNLRQNIGRPSSSHTAIKKPLSTVKCSLAQAMSMERLSQKVKSKKTFVQLVDQIEGGGKCTEESRQLNCPLREDEWRNGLYYRRNQISKSVKFISNNYQSLQAYKDSTPISLDLDYVDEKPIQKIIRTISTASTHKRMRKHKIRFASTAQSLYRDRQ